MDLFQRVMNVALAPDDAIRAHHWKQLLTRVFQPLEITEVTTSESKEVAIHDDGLSMELPAAGPLCGLRLAYTKGGRSLFRPDDALQAQELIAMLEHGLESLEAYEKGVFEERGRIARDMHDNICAALLGALHSPEAETKDLKVRQSLADLRKVINEMTEQPASIATTLADLRIETAERLEAVGIRLSWSTKGTEDTVISRTVGHAARSIIREAVSNVIRHSGAGELEVLVCMEADGLRLQLKDNGHGFNPQICDGGNGLTNMRTRIDFLKGVFDLHSSPGGTTLDAHIPIQTTSTGAN